MGIKSKLVTLVAGLIGLSSFSQAPEFSQQYRQRLGGAVQELGVVVGDFDKNAKSALLSREEALGKLQGSKEQFVQDRGNSMGKTINRFDKLAIQQANLESSNGYMQPLFVLQNPDLELVKGAWSIYQPAIPLNKEGAVYGGFGALFAMLLARLGIGGWRGSRRRAKKNAVLGKPAKSKSDKVLVAQVEASNAAGIDVTTGLEPSGVEYAKSLENLDNIQDLENFELTAKKTSFSEIAARKSSLLAVEEQHANAMQFRQKIHGEVDPAGKVVRMRRPTKS